MASSFIVFILLLAVSVQTQNVASVTSNISNDTNNSTANDNLTKPSEVPTENENKTAGTPSKQEQNTANNSANNNETQTNSASNFTASTNQTLGNEEPPIPGTANNKTTTGGEISPPAVSSNATNIVSQVAPASSSGTISITETGLANTTKGPAALSMSMSGRYLYDPVNGVTINQTRGTLTLQQKSLTATANTTNNNSSGTDAVGGGGAEGNSSSLLAQSPSLSNNATTATNETSGVIINNQTTSSAPVLPPAATAKINVSNYNLTGTKITVSENLQSIRIKSELASVASFTVSSLSNNSRGAAADNNTLYASLAFDVPIDFTANNQTLNTTTTTTSTAATTSANATEAAGFVLNNNKTNILSARIDNVRYNASSATTSGQLSTFLNVFSTLRQELSSTNAREIVRDIQQGNSTIPDKIQGAMFQSLNVTVPTISELQNITEDQRQQLEVQNLTKPALESTIKPLLENLSSSPEGQNLTSGERQLLDIILSLNDTDLTQGQQIQLNILTQQLLGRTINSGNTSNATGAAIVLENGATMTTTREPNARTVPAVLYYTSTTPTFDNRDIRPVQLLELIGSLLPNLLLHLPDFICLLGGILAGNGGKLAPLLNDMVPNLLSCLNPPKHKDVTPPKILAPPDKTLSATGDRTFVDLGFPLVIDNADPSPKVTNDAPTNGFPAGNTMVKWTATDASGNSATAIQKVTILRTVVPTTFTITQTGIAISSSNQQLPPSSTVVNGENSNCKKLRASNLQASGDDGHVPANTLDGSLGTRWSGYGTGSWIQLGLGSEKVICNLEIAWYKGNARANTFSISVSNDGLKFRNVYSSVSTGKSASPERYDIPDTAAKYVRIIVYGNTVNKWASVTEINVKGYDPAVQKASIAYLKITGNYLYDKPTNSISIDKNSLEAKITITDIGTGKRAVLEDLSPIQIARSQADKKITIMAQIDNPLKKGSAASSLRFDLPVNFRYGGTFASPPDANNVLVLKMEGGKTFDTDGSSSGTISIQAPVSLLLLG